MKGLKILWTDFLVFPSLQKREARNDSVWFVEKKHLQKNAFQAPFSPRHKKIPIVLSEFELAKLSEGSIGSLAGYNVIIISKKWKNAIS